MHRPIVKSLRLSELRPGQLARGVSTASAIRRSIGKLHQNEHPRTSRGNDSVNWSRGSQPKEPAGQWMKNRRREPSPRLRRAPDSFTRASRHELPLHSRGRRPVAQQPPSRREQWSRNDSARSIPAAFEKGAFAQNRPVLRTRDAGRGRWSLNDPVVAVSAALEKGAFVQKRPGSQIRETRRERWSPNGPAATASEALEKGASTHERPVSRMRDKERDRSSRNDPVSITREVPKESAFSQKLPSSRTKDIMPVSIPHTTAASEFLYGRSAVESALRAGRRKLYKLYVFNSESISAASQSSREPAIKLAQHAGVQVEALDSDRLLQKISGGRPTNGLVLEASPLPFLKCTSLEDVDRQSGRFEIARSEQSHEELEISGNESMIHYPAQGKRYPFLLFLDGILDPGNLGGILRSAYFLGADAVVLSTHGSPLTATALKAASGAAETLPILTTRSTGPFIRTSQSNGWKFFAATPLPDDRGRSPKPVYSLETLGYPLVKHPSVVMLGGEGSGLWEDIKQKADFFVSIKGSRGGQDGIDSLNVSVSAALLTQAFMKTSPYQTPRNRLWEDAAA